MNKQQAIKKIISEEIVRFEKIKNLEDKKKQLSEAINLLESGEQLDEFSWQGIKNAVGLGGKKAADLGASAGKAVADKASAVNKGIDNKVNALGKTIGKQAAAIGDKISTGYNSVDSSMKQLGSELSNAMTAGDIHTIEVKIEKMFMELQKMVSALNQKQQKLGVKPTTMNSILFKVMGKKPKKSAAPQLAETKKK